MKELAGVERSTHEPLGFLDNPWVFDPNGTLQRRLGFEPGIPNQRGTARDESEQGDQGGELRIGNHQARRLNGCQYRGQRGTGSTSQQQAVHQSQRTGPFLEKTNAHVDHAGAHIQSQAEQGGHRTDEPRGVSLHQMREAIEKNAGHEQGKGDAFARKPGSAPHGHATPGPLRLTQMKE